jgi:hypothetical protein
VLQGWLAAPLHADVTRVSEDGRPTDGPDGLA